MRTCADEFPPGILRRCAPCATASGGANRGLVSAPKAKQKRARRLFFVWYSRWESNPERPLRRGLLYPFNYGSISCYPAGNTSSLRSSCHRKRRGEPGTIFPASMQKHILLSRAGILRRCAPRATASGGPFERRRSPQNREPLEHSLFYNVSRKKATVFEGEV